MTIEVGDKLHLEYTVKSVMLFDNGSSLLSLMRLNCDGNEEISCRQSMSVRGDHEHPAIVKHVPKPYEPEPGHVVCNQGGFHWKVLAVNSGRAWCRSTDCNDERLFDFNLLTFYGFGDDKS